MIERMRNPYYPKVDKREMSPQLYNSPNIGSVAGYWSKYASQGQGKFKIGDKIQYGNVKDEYKVVSGLYQDGSYDVIHTPTGTLYNKQQVTTAILKGQANKVVTFTSTIGVGKDHGKSVEYKVGEIVKGHLSGNFYKIDKVDDDGIVHLVVQKTGPMDSHLPATIIRLLLKALQRFIRKLIRQKQKIKYSRLAKNTRNP